MRRWIGVGIGCVMAWSLGGARGWAQAPQGQEAGTVATLSPSARYPALTSGQLVWVNGQRLVVTQEPDPVATIKRAPPPPPQAVGNPPPAPYRGAIWVAAHWTYGAAGLSWVDGCYVAPRPGHVFVPPRWASAQGQYLYFNGFYVPYGVFVRSHFNRYYYSGTPGVAGGSDHGPYWPVGAPSVAPASSRPSARDPYWPVGAPR